MKEHVAGKRFANEHVAGKRFANDEDLMDAGRITRRPRGMKRMYTNFCQDTTSAFNLKGENVEH